MKISILCTILVTVGSVTPEIVRVSTAGPTNPSSYLFIATAVTSLFSDYLLIIVLVIYTLLIAQDGHWKGGVAEPEVVQKQSFIPTVPTVSALYNFVLLKIQHGGQLPSGKYKKHDISEIIWTYFSRISVC